MACGLIRPLEESQPGPLTNGGAGRLGGPVRFINALCATAASVFRQTNKHARKKVKFHAKIKGFKYLIEN